MTVDCGISDAAEVAWARDQGLEVIVTDHHEIPPELPPALAVVNPKRGGPDYPFGDLAGVGVALLLALGVRAELRSEGWFSRHKEPNLKAYLDLVALGTAADVVPILGENRILMRQGLKVLEESRRPGLVALKEVTRLEGKTHLLSGRGLPAGAPAQCRRAHGPGPLRPGTAPVRRPGPGPAPGQLSAQPEPAAPGPGRDHAQGGRGPGAPGKVAASGR